MRRAHEPLPEMITIQFSNMKINFLNKLALITVLFLSATTASAHDFEVDGIFYQRNIAINLWTAYLIQFPNNIIINFTQKRSFTSIHFLDAQFKHLICDILHRWKYAFMVKVQNGAW